MLLHKRKYFNLCEVYRQVLKCIIVLLLQGGEWKRKDKCYYTGSDKFSFDK